MNRRRITRICFFGLIPLIVLGGAVLFREQHYAWITLCVAVLTCLPIWCDFERRETGSAELMVLSVLISLSVAGRFLFAWLPGFKPVTAITVISAMWLGAEPGFVVGSLTALLSNFYFGQGPWTPFQMFSWGLIGGLAGLLAKPLRRHRLLLCIYGVLAGFFYSLVMDLWSTFWMGGGLSLSRYLALIGAALPITIEYAVSNVIFLLALAGPIGEKLDRLRVRYGLFREHR
ncbi:MAG: ECF transporter S component [Lachnospiraceae bacterium]|nr:ECF transporter S component [Lachnospiraceae bacterium]